MIQVITVLSWVFNYVYVLTSGGPGYASSVMELYIWRSFSNGANGTAASVAVMLLGMASVLIGLSLWVRRRAGTPYERRAAQAARRHAWRGTRSSMHHQPRGALPALVHRLDGAQVERRLPARSDGLPDAPDVQLAALDHLRPAAAALDVEQLPRHASRRSRSRR